MIPNASTAWPDPTARPRMLMLRRIRAMAFGGVNQNRFDSANEKRGDAGSARSPLA